MTGTASPIPHKLIVTNHSALTSKYGPTRTKRVVKAINALIASDRVRGVNSELVYIDRASSLKRFGAVPVPSPDAQKETKEVIDSLFRATEAHYLAIVGAPDVVTHQSLWNPVQNSDDPDDDVPSDLPYACAAPYSRDAADFLAPSRVVGRVPGLEGVDDEKPLLAALSTATTWKRRLVRSYDSAFSVSAKAWKASTRQTVRAIFGTVAGLELSPPDGPRWTAAQLKRRSHFFNLHGADFSSTFYGDDLVSQPDAHVARRLVGRVRDGTVVAAECCYGAMLYEPSTWSPTGICNTYMSEGAYGFVGATNIAYGPAAGNSAADLITRYFFIESLRGASIGRAMLIARQRFVTASAPMDPIALKTIAQFILLGDPSVHPVRAPKPKTRARRKSAALTDSGRASRRKALARKAQDLFGTIASVRAQPRRKKGVRSSVAGGAEKHIESFCKQHGLPVPRPVASFVVQACRHPEMAKSLTAKKRAAGGAIFHVASALVPLPPPMVDAATKPKSALQVTAKAAIPAGVRQTINRQVILVAREDEGGVGEVRAYIAR